MQTLMQKLNYRAGMEILVINPPEGMELIDRELENPRTLRLPGMESRIGDLVPFALVFVLDQRGLREALDPLWNRLEGDCLLWIAYPKKTSRKYKADLDRDHGWDSLGAHGYEPVRQVALDEDFSAVRFRKLEYIKKMIRPEEAMLTRTKK